ncbi:unnamed protein product [Phytomonas sp. Hart1]|nr:unnamed protein product [Phytomonas sp. Hart1]|eukprot:CCW69641.1 unnamed protein product [Phytomonas sp. isolate Hart1]
MQASIRSLSHEVCLPTGLRLPALGQGTWQMGDQKQTEEEEINALRGGINAGLTVIDTAEFYGDGRSERLVGRAIKAFPREKLFIVSKVLPTNANPARMTISCERSLRNLGLEWLDLYLLHWRGGENLAEVVKCMESLVDKGLIKQWGVSNFDLDDMEQLWRIPKGNHCVVNQVLYHLGSRGIEFDLMPWMAAKKVPVMAYCPIAQAGEIHRGIYSNDVVKQIAARHHATIPQILLAFTLHTRNVIAIPKSSNPAHTAENAAADKIELTDEDMKELNTVFPPPNHKICLDIV